jgi:hypothetical protein
VKQLSASGMHKKDGWFTGGAQSSKFPPNRHQHEPRDHPTFSLNYLTLVRDGREETLVTGKQIAPTVGRFAIASSRKSRFCSKKLQTSSGNKNASVCTYLYTGHYIQSICPHIHMPISMYISLLCMYGFLPFGNRNFFRRDNSQNHSCRRGCTCDLAELPSFFRESATVAVSVQVLLFERTQRHLTVDTANRYHQNFVASFTYRTNTVLQASTTLTNNSNPWSL